jgi:hypothetical protein
MGLLPVHALQHDLDSHGDRSSTRRMTGRTGLQGRGFLGVTRRRRSTRDSTKDSTKNVDWPYTSAYHARRKGVVRREYAHDGRGAFLSFVAVLACTSGTFT